MAKMTSKERMLAAIRLDTPDCIPCTPDFSNMIPCKLSGRPFWDIYYYGKESLYDAYCRAAKYYGIDGWYQTGVEYTYENPLDVQRAIESVTDERMIVRRTIHTDAGDLTACDTYYVADPPTVTEKLIKDIERDFPIFKKTYNRITGLNRDLIEKQRAQCGDDGLFCLCIGYPGMQYFETVIQGGLIEAVYAECDYPEIFEEWRELEHKNLVRQMELILDARPDCVLLGGSGTLTLSNPEKVRKYALPSIVELTRMAKQAGIPTMLHSCGKSGAFLDMLYHETDLNCVNPLEIPPMGDVNLADCKRKYGDRLCLMGNLHTTDVMLRGTVEDVERAARQAIADAGPNGFILSTGDQCGRDTPPANIFKLVEIAHKTEF